MIYYDLFCIINVLVALLIYMIIFNVIVIITVRKYRDNQYFQSSTIPSQYSNLILAFNYIIVLIFIFVLLKDYILNKDFEISNFYNMWVMVSAMIYVNLFSIIIYAYQMTTNINLSGNLLEKRSIFSNKKIELSNQTKLKVWVNYYKVSSKNKSIVFNRLKYDDSIEIVIRKIEDIVKSSFLN